VFANAIMDFVLYRAYMKDAEYAGNAQRASTHYQLFANSIGQGSQAQTLLSPNNPTGALPINGAGINGVGV
jgi:aspartate/methionine/tyrosine aminotransferase